MTTAFNRVISGTTKGPESLRNNSFLYNSLDSPKDLYSAYICTEASDTRFFPEERFIARKDKVQTPVGLLGGTETRNYDKKV